MSNPGILQLFYRGMDNGVWTRWRNPDGSWSTEQSLGGVLNGSPIAARLPGTDVIQLFYRGSDNGVWSRWRNTDGSWSDEQNLGGALINPIAAQVPAWMSSSSFTSARLTLYGLAGATQTEAGPTNRASGLSWTARSLWP